MGSNPRPEAEEGYVFWLSLVHTPVRRTPPLLYWELGCCIKKVGQHGREGVMVHGDHHDLTFMWIAWTNMVIRTIHSISS